MAALTRISNNQAQSNSIHADKLQRYTLTGDIWANNLVYASTLTVANLVVYGNSTVINSVNTTISDPVIEINAEYTGAPVLDQALLFGRGDQNNTGLVWKEQGVQQFQLVYTAATANANPGTITADRFANLQVRSLIGDSVDLIGNLTAYWVNATNFYATGSVFADTDVNATGNVSANWVNANNFHAVANVYFDQDAVVTGNIYAVQGTFTDTVTANSFITTGPSGNIAGADFVIANYYVGDGSLLTGMYSNINVSEYLPFDQNIIDIQSNISSLWSNAADQSANIDALWSNSAVQDLEIGNIFANLDQIASNLDILYNNVAALSANIDALWNNAAAISANIGDLYNNAAVQNASILSLFDLANLQASNIATLFDNAAVQWANIDALWSNVAGLSGNIDALWANAAGQDLEISNIISGTTTLDSVTTTYDANIGGNVNTSNWVNTNNINLASALFAAGNAGLQGQYLTSTGTSAYWATHFYNDALPPDTPNYGDIWYDIPDNKLYMWVTDGGSDFWYDFLPPTF